MVPHKLSSLLSPAGGCPTGPLLEGILSPHGQDARDPCGVAAPADPGPGLPVPRQRRGPDGPANRTSGISLSTSSSNRRRSPWGLAVTHPWLQCPAPLRPALLRWRPPCGAWKLCSPALLPRWTLGSVSTTGVSGRRHAAADRHMLGPARETGRAGATNTITRPRLSSSSLP
ncbi:hypothetical protein E2C01_027052 [Portunus trituberculatus]|uniref:Uncharacterized protein n=1 Tax=Portunus trituberculatus TaxID=210409 RepID=A0A5B7EHR9_PORTR|nr:hypothetical protein [Portunus trituberculatus]